MTIAQFQALAMAAVGVYFTVQNAAVLLRYRRLRRVQKTALLTWQGRRPAYMSLFTVLGVISAVLAVTTGVIQGKALEFFSQASIAIYFLAVSPRLGGVQPGLYEQGILSDGRFIPYEHVGRWTFVERPEIALLIVPKGNARTMRLGIPPGEYGAVRKVLFERIRLHIVEPADKILGL